MIYLIILLLTGLAIGLFWFADSSNKNAKETERLSAIAIEKKDSLEQQLEISNNLTIAEEEARKIAVRKGDSLNLQLGISDSLRIKEFKARLSAETNAQLAKDSADYARLQQKIAEGETRKAKSSFLILQAKQAADKGDFRLAMLLASYSWKYAQTDEIYGTMNNIWYKHLLKIDNQIYSTPIPKLLNIFPNYFDSRPFFSPNGKYLFTDNDVKSKTTIWNTKGEDYLSLKGEGCTYSLNYQLIRTFNRKSRMNYIWTKEGVLLDSIPYLIFEFTNDNSAAFSIPYNGKNPKTEIYLLDKRQRKSLSKLYNPNKEHIIHYNALNDQENSYLLDEWGYFKKKYKGSNGAFSPSKNYVFTQSSGSTKIYRKEGALYSVINGDRVFFSKDEKLVIGNVSRKWNRTGIWNIDGIELKTVEGTNPTFQKNEKFYTFDADKNVSYLWDFNGDKIREVDGEYKFSLNSSNYDIFYNRENHASRIVNSEGDYLLELNGSIVDIASTDDAITTEVNERAGIYNLWYLKDNPITQFSGEVKNEIFENKLIFSKKTSWQNYETIIADLNGNLGFKIKGRFLKILNLNYFAVSEGFNITIWDKSVKKIGKYKGTDIIKRGNDLVFIHNLNQVLILKNHTLIDSFPVKSNEILSFNNKLIQRNGYHIQTIVYDLSGQILDTLEGRNPDASVNGKWLTTIDLDYTYLWNSDLENVIIIPGSYHCNTLFSPNCSLFFTPYINGKFTLRKMDGSIFDTIDLPAFKPRFSHDSKFMFSYDEYTIESFAWNINLRKLIKFPEGIDPKLSPKSNFITTYNEVDNSTFLWNKNGIQIAKFYGVNPLFAKDEKHLITYSPKDEKSYLWPISPKHHIKKIVERGLDLTEDEKNSYRIDLDLN